MALKRALMSYNFCGTAAELDAVVHFLRVSEFCSVRDLVGAAHLENLVGYDTMEVRYVAAHLADLMLVTSGSSATVAA